MRKAVVCLLVLVLSGLVVADPGISLPEELKLQPGRLAKLEAKTTGKTVRWINLDPDNLDLIPSESGRWVIISAAKAGTYRVAAYTALNGEPTEAAICAVTVAGPKPPDPPVPPIPPQPTDPLAKELQALYTADPAPAELKRQVTMQLANLYREGVKMCDDPAYETVGAYHAALKGKAPLVGDTLLPMRERMGLELAGVLGKVASIKFDDTKRVAMRAILNKLIAILGVLQ